METIKFLTGALIFGAFLAGIVVMLLAVLWMVGKSQQGKEDNDEHAEARSRNRKPTYVYSLSCVPITGVREDVPPRAADTGKRLETVEISLRSFNVLQSRALQNGKSDEHDHILDLCRRNVPELKRRAARMTVPLRDWITA